MPEAADDFMKTLERKKSTPLVRWKPKTKISETSEYKNKIDFSSTF
jgi:hypothetical protein